jgi:hypothetical protein
MTAIVPISVSIPGVGQIRFPKALQGKEVSEQEYKALWKEHITPHIPQKPGKRTS